MFGDFDEAQQRIAQPEYQVLARRTRPQSFSELVGQQAAVNAIEGMIASDKVPHAFLFTGTRGTGKTSSARILAKSLCCERGPTLNPCQTCNHCVQITACAHEDVYEIDGASHTGDDNIRELRESARFFPQSSRYKVFIIDEVHMLSVGAFNALLKTLEEPPPQVIFILATTELHKVPVTVRSRCMILSFRKIDPTTIAEHLSALLKKDSIAFSADALQLIAREAKGSIRDSLSLLEQVLALGMHQSVSLEGARAALSVMGEGLCQNLFAGILQKDSQQCLEAIAEIDASSLDYGHVLETTAQLFRGAIVLKQAGKDSTKRSRASELLNLLPSELEFLERESDQVSVSALIEIFRALSQAAREVLRTTAQKAWAEVTVIDCISRTEWLSSGELLGMLADAGNNSPTLNQKQTHNPRVQTAQKAQTEGHVRTPVREEDSKTANSQLIHSFTTLVGIIQTRNIQLGVKLKHAKVECFSPQQLIFADCPENKLFAQLTEQEADVFFSALDDMGCSECRIEGISLPSRYQRAKPNPSSSRQTPQSHMQQASAASDKVKSDCTTHSIHRTVSPEQKPSSPSEAVRNLVRDDPFATPSASGNQKKNEPLTPRVDGGVSLAKVEQAEELRKWNKRQEELKLNPIIRRLEALGAEIEVRPLARKKTL